MSAPSFTYTCQLAIHACAVLRSNADRNTQTYHRLTNAVRAADRAMEDAGEGGTRHWLTEYFLPALEAEGLAVIALPRAPSGALPGGSSPTTDTAGEAGA